MNEWRNKTYSSIHFISLTWVLIFFTWVLFLINFQYPQVFSLTYLDEPFMKHTWVKYFLRLHIGKICFYSFPTWLITLLDIKILYIVAPLKFYLTLIGFWKKKNKKKGRKKKETKPKWFWGMFLENFISTFGNFWYFFHRRNTKRFLIYVFVLKHFN